VTASYTYADADILREVRGSTTLQYVHGPGIDAPLVADDGAVQSYFHADALGSIVKITNAASAVTLTRQYDAWGNFESGATEAGHAFTGREWDPETGLYYYRARYLDPKTGRFTAQDPMKPWRWLQAFPYADNNPCTRVDPLGLQSSIGGGYGTLPLPRIPGRPDYCGSGWTTGFVPERVDGVDISECCSKHDGCYETCGGPGKGCCDWNLGNCIEEKCEKAGKISRDPVHPTLCQLAAAQYWSAVFAWGGGAYEAAQCKSCGKCRRPQPPTWRVQPGWM
jgi:RHS repeat-associated protein